MNQGKKFRCELLGRFRLFGTDGQEIKIPVAKGAAIIAYMLLSGESSTPRSVLTGLLWSERSEAAARTALRQCLHQMKNRSDPAAFELLHITQDHIALSIEDIETDIGQLSREGFAGKTGAQQLDIDHLLYGLEDLDPAFSEWLWDQRRRQKTQICKALTQQLEAQNNPEQRLHLAEALHELDPCLEVAARPLIEHHIRVGNIVGLLSVYKRLWNALEERWEEEPSQALQQIVGNARVMFAEHLPTTADRSAHKQARKYVSALVARCHPKEDVQGNAHKADCDAFRQLAEPLLAGAGAILIPTEDASITAVFGVPNAHEDDAWTAISTAIALRDLVVESFDFRQSFVSVGLDAGLVDTYRDGTSPKDIVATGTTLVNAAQLANVQQPPVSVQASLRMARRLDFLFDIQPLRHSPLGIEAVTIAGHAAQSDGRPVTLLDSLIGRGPFIAALRTAWDQAQADGLQTICLQGPAGIGKTRLAHEFLSDMTQEMPTLAIVRCNRYDRSAPLEPIHTLLRLLTGQQTDPLATKETLLSDLIEALYDASGTLFVDDWHWVDDASRSLFQDLALAIQDQPILLVLAARDTSLDDGLIRTSHQIYVPPLNAKEVQRRAEQVLGRPIDAALKSRIFQKSGGNPLYLEEICRALKALEGGVTDDPISEAFTADLHSLIAGRIDTLDTEDSKIIFAISVNGETVEKDLLTQVLGFTVPKARLERLFALDLLRPDATDTRLQFKHGLTCDVSYGMIPAPERTALHARYFAAFLEKSRQTGTTDYAESLARHARASGSMIDAIEYAEQAGNKALAASSLDQAERQFSTALTLIEELEQAPDWKARWLSIALRWARPCVYAASSDHMPILEKAMTVASELGDDAKLGEVLYWTGYNLIVRGEYAEAIDYLQRSQKLASGLGLSRLATEATAILGYALALLSQYDQAEPYINIAIGTKDKHPVRKGRAPVTSAYARSILALIYGEQGRFDAAEEALQTALFRVSEFEHEIESSILTTGAIMLIWRGRWSKAREFARRARNRSERVSAPYMIGTSRCLFCYVDWKISGNLDSLAEFERTAHWLDAQGMRLFLSLIFGWLSDALADAGRYKNARSVALRVLDWTEESGECLGAAMACRTLARCAMIPQGEGKSAAQEHLKNARHWAQHRGAVHETAACALLEAEILLNADDPAKGLAALKEAKAIFEKLGMPAFLQNPIFQTEPSHPPADVTAS